MLFDMVGSCSVCLAAFLFSFLLLDPFIDFLKGLQQPFLLPCWPSEVIYHASWGTHKTGFKVGECWFVLWNRAWVLHLEWFISTIGWFLGIMEKLKIISIMWTVTKTKIRVRLGQPFFWKSAKYGLEIEITKIWKPFLM